MSLRSSCAAGLAGIGGRCMQQRRRRHDEPAPRPRLATVFEEQEFPAKQPRPSLRTLRPRPDRLGPVAHHAQRPSNAARADCCSGVTQGAEHDEVGVGSWRSALAVVTRAREERKLKVAEVEVSFGGRWPRSPTGTKRGRRFCFFSFPFTASSARADERGPIQPS